MSIQAPPGLQDTNRRFELAVEEGDFQRAAREVYTEDACIMPPDSPLIRGQQAIGEFWAAAAGQLGLKKVQLSTIDLITGGDHACEIGQATLFLDDSQEAVVKYVVYWQKASDRWRWHVDIWNSGT